MDLALDLDGDGDERTGWVIFYLHLDQRTRALRENNYTPVI